MSARTKVKNSEAADNASAHNGRYVSVTGKGVASNKLKNYANDPYFVKKAAEAKAEIDRIGLPGAKK